MINSLITGKKNNRNRKLTCQPFAHGPDCVPEKLKLVSLMCYRLLLAVDSQLLFTSSVFLTAAEANTVGH